MCSQQCVGVHVKNLRLLASIGIFEASEIYISTDILTVVFNIIVIKYVLQFTFCSCHLCFPTVLASGLDVVSVCEIHVCLNSVLCQK